MITTTQRNTIREIRGIKGENARISSKSRNRIYLSATVSWTFGDEKNIENDKI